MIKRPFGEAAGQRGTKAYPSGYVEGLLEPGTKPRDMFSIRGG